MLAQTEQVKVPLAKLFFQYYYTENIGNYTEALRYAQQTYDLATALYDVDQPDVLTAMHNLAGAYYNLGKYDKALPLQMHVLEIEKKHLATTMKAIYQ